MLLIDHYAYNNKLVSVHPGEKFLFFVLTISLCLSVTSVVTSLAVICVMAGAIVLLAGVPWRFYLKLLLLPGAFLIVGVITLMLTLTREQQGFIWFTGLGPYAVGITSHSLDVGVNLFLRSLGSVSCLYFLSLTTPMTDIVSVLRKLRVPALVVELTTFIYRFLFVLLEVAGKVYVAQSCRLGYKSMATGFNSLGRLVVSIFLNSYVNSQAVYNALVARCYTGNLPGVEDNHSFSMRNVLLILAVDGLLATGSLYAGGIL